MLLVGLLLSFCFVFGDTAISVNGIGGSFQWPLFDDWSYVYTTNHTSAVFNYTVVSGALTNREIVRPDPTADYFSSIALYRNDTDLAGKQDSIQFIPFTLGSLVPIYNIPDMVYKDGSPGTPQLVLSGPALADIFRGRILYWNDSRISIDNPNVLLPDAPITVILRKDNSGFTYALTEAFRQFVPDWQFKPSNAWPAQLKNLSNVYVTSDTFGMIADTNRILYSIGYATLPQLVTQKISLVSNYALLKNMKGNLVYPTQEYILQAQMNKTFDEHLFTNFINSPDGWPIVMAAFTSIRTDVKQDCEVLRELYKFLHWTLTDPYAISRASALGFSHWNKHLTDQIVNFLTTATCDGNLILYYKVQEQHRGPSFIAFLILAMILLGFSIILGFVWQYMNKYRCSKTVLLYQTILMLGVIMTYISVIFWYSIPDTNSICQARIWLTTMGYCMILTAMFERTFQIKRVHGKVVKGNQLTATVAGLLEMGGTVGFVIVLQIILMVVWTAVDPYYSVYVPQETPFDVTYACRSSNVNVWLSLESIYFGILLLWTIYVVYSTWSIRTFIIESRWILIAMYNILLFLGLLATLLATLKEDDDLLYNIIVPFIELSTTTVVVAVYSPAVLLQLKLIASTGSSQTVRTRSLQTGEEVPKSPKETDIELN